MGRLRIPFLESSTRVSPATIFVCFEELAISEVFSELLRARGERTRVITSTTECPADGRLVTEPQFFLQLPLQKKVHCLVVGNKDTVSDLPAVVLSRPLTEAKVEKALREFLLH